MKYLIDSYAWIEYLNGSSAGEKVNKILNNNKEIYTLNLIISEIISRMSRLNQNSGIAYKAIISNAKIINLSPEISKNAGLLHAEIRKTIKDFGLVDAILLSLARDMKAKIVTGDEHFKKFKEAIFIK